MAQDTMLREWRRKKPISRPFRFLLMHMGQGKRVASCRTAAWLVAVADDSLLAAGEFSKVAATATNQDPSATTRELGF